MKWYYLVIGLLLLVYLVGTSIIFYSAYSADAVNYDWHDCYVIGYLTVHCDDAESIDDTSAFIMCRDKKFWIDISSLDDLTLILPFSNQEVMAEASYKVENDMVWIKIYKIWECKNGKEEE